MGGGQRAAALLSALWRRAASSASRAGPSECPLAAGGEHCQLSWTSARRAHRGPAWWHGSTATLRGSLQHGTLPTPASTRLCQQCCTLAVAPRHCLGALYQTWHASYLRCSCVPGTHPCTHRRAALTPSPAPLPCGAACCPSTRCVRSRTPVGSWLLGASNVANSTCKQPSSKRLVLKVSCLDLTPRKSADPAVYEAAFKTVTITTMHLGTDG